MSMLIYFKINLYGTKMYKYKLCMIDKGTISEDLRYKGIIPSVYFR